MKPTNDDDLDGPSREFSLPSEIVKVPRLARVNMRQVAPREIESPESADAPQMDIGRYLHALRRNWLLGVILGIVCSVPMAALMWKLSAFEYTAVEYLRLSNHIPLVFETVADQSMRGEARSFKSTQRQLLLQPLSLSKALKDSGVAQASVVRDMKDPITFLAKNIKVVFPDDGEIMNVSLTLTDGNVAHKIVKSVVDMYMAEVVDKEKSERAYRIERLEKILADSKEKVRKKLNELSNTVEQLGTGDSTTLNLAQQNVLQQFGFLRGELSRIKVEVMRLRGELESRGISQKLTEENTKASAEPKSTDASTTSGAASGSESKVGSDQNTKLKSGDSQAGPESMADITDVFLLEALESDPVSIQLNNSIEQLTRKIEQTKKRYDPKMAESYVKKDQVRLAEVRIKLADRIKRIRQMSSAPGSPSSNRTEELVMKISILDKQQMQIQGEMDALEVESKKFGKSSIDVEMKRKEIGGLDPVVDKVSQEIERTRIEMQSAPRVYLFPTMGPPTTGENKKRIPMTLAGAVAGLLFPLVLLVFLDSQKNHVNNLGTINHGLKLNVLGSIPRIPNRLMRRLNDPADMVTAAWRERIAESMAAVTAMLLRKLANEGHRVIMVTSATAGEGKSTLCEQLSRSLANSGHRTLLIDFDLRRPNLHLRFDAPLEPGVSEVLRHGADLLQTIRATDLPNLGLLSAGNCLGSLLLESANGTLEALFNQCRMEYELVLVDSSPLLPVVDGRIVGQHTDGAILTIVKDRSQVPQVLAARKILDDYDISVLGCVFTGDKGDGYYGGGSTYGSYGRLSEQQSAAGSEIDSARPTSAM